MPTILTVTACTCVVGTGVTAGIAGMQYQNDISEGEPKLRSFFKRFWLPAAFGAGAITSFCFARAADKAMIAGLSAGLSGTVSRLEAPEIPDDGTLPLGTVILDEDGDLYYEKIGGLFIKMTETTYYCGIARINKNFTNRGVCSLYELYRMFGITKRDIKENGLEWTKYVGWFWEDVMIDKEMIWLDSFVSKEDGYKELVINDPMTPLTANVPTWIHDICGTDVDEVDNKFGSDDRVVQEIACDIQDGGAE